jgi:hypothetical protein
MYEKSSNFLTIIFKLIKFYDINLNKKKLFLDMGKNPKICTLAKLYKWPRFVEGWLS